MNPRNAKKGTSGRGRPSGDGPAGAGQEARARLRLARGEDACLAEYLLLRGIEGPVLRYESLRDALASAAQASLFGAAGAVMAWRVEIGKEEAALLERLAGDPGPPLLVYAPKLPRGGIHPLREEAGVVLLDSEVGTKARLGYVAEAAAREGIRLLPDWQEGVDPSASFGVLLESVRGAALTVPEGRPVGKEHLLRLASAAHAGVFGFVDAFLAKRFEEAFGMLEKLLAQGEGAARLWATLLGQWRLLTYLKDGELPQGVAPHPYVRQKLSRVLGLWTPEELRKGFAAFLWFDEQMKSGREPRAALVAALLEIAQASARRGA